MDINKEVAEKVRCAICGTKDRDYRHDHLRVCAVNRQGQLSSGYYKPKLSDHELWMLSHGENNICSNRSNCRNRLSAIKETS